MIGMKYTLTFFFFFSSRRRHTRFKCDWSSDVCSSDLVTSRAAICLGIVGLVFGLLFVLLQRLIARQIAARDVTGEKATALDADEESYGALSRRALLKNVAVAAAIVLAGVGAIKFITSGIRTSKVAVGQLVAHYKSKIVPPPQPNYGELHPAQFPSPALTSKDQCYVVSKNLYADPTVNGNSWSLMVNGQVDSPFTLTSQEMLSQPMHQQYY